MVLWTAVSIPYVQGMLGDVASSALRKAYGWDISIGNIRWGLWNRIIIDDITLRDRQDSTLLHASRLAAKVNLLPLTRGQISIDNAQLFGTQVHVYQNTPQAKPNFQFLIDTFSSTDTTSTPINLRIGSILLRRVSVEWHQQWKPRKAPGILDPAHLRLSDIAVTARLRALTADSLNLTLKRLSFKEENGLTFKNLSFDLVAGQHGATLGDFRLELPHSMVAIPSAEVSWPDFPHKGLDRSWLGDVSLMAGPSVHITPSDLSPLAPWLKAADTPVDIRSVLLFSEACLNVPSLEIHDGKSLDLQAKAFVYDVIGSPECRVSLDRLHLNSTVLDTYLPPASSIIPRLSPIASRLDSINVSGQLQWSNLIQGCTLRLTNKYGQLDINATAREWNQIDARVLGKDIQLNRILSDNGNHALGRASLEVTAKGHIADAQGKPDIDIRTTLPLLQWQGREYGDIDIHAHLRGSSLEAKADVQDRDGDIHSRLTWKRDGRQHLAGYVNVGHIRAERLGLGDRYPDTHLSIKTVIDLSGNNIDDITGSVGIRDFVIHGTGADSSLTIGPLAMSIATDMDRRGYRRLNVSSVPLNLSACGHFRFSTLATTVLNSLHYQLPEIIPYRRPSSAADTLLFSLGLQDTVLIRRLALKDISIPLPMTLEGSIHGSDSMSLRGDIPEIGIGQELLRNGRIDIQGRPQATKATVSVERRHKKGFVTLSLRADAHDDRLRLIAGLDNRRSPRICGDLDITTTFLRKADGKHDIRAWIAPSDLIISDTIWKVHPCNITWDGQTADIRGFRVNQSAHRGIDINGRASAASEDTLRVNFREISVDYILDLVNFRDVEFSGMATGSAYATGLLSRPNASANLTVQGFAFNRAPLGTLHALANWGDTPHRLSLDATISDPPNHHHSTIDGGFHLGDPERPNGMDLRVRTQGFNLAFINMFTTDILEDFQGRASGYCRIYGPFNAIDLKGDMMVDYASFGLPMLGTAYSLEQDSVHIRPGEISIAALLSDKHAAPVARPFAIYANNGQRSDIPHTAILHGRLMHRHFKDMSYDFRVRANKFLGYDFRDFGESSFYATCIATGDISVSGVPGRLMVDINATPEQGTVFTYNVTTPDALTDADFITISSRDTLLPADPAGTLVRPLQAQGQYTQAAPTSDLYIDFNLPITQAAKIRLLMDRKSGDMIEIGGNGRIRAKYYNKGRFNIYGTYHVQEGTYRMSLQDIIRKEFTFQPGGTIVFGGDAMKADLNLKALYSVNSVSLDDLTASSLGFSKTRVDCIMNLTGHPEQPAVTFDFDLPNATEDERQMVRSVVSTEEERNMQAIYLLGLGRFYNFEADGAEQSSAAMNSLVSSTLSSHLNNLITTAVGSRNWRVNTFLQTSEDGWRNMDVEGQLSGSLFNNRLLLTGNFGYREKYYTQRNFISDVTIEYLLTRNGMLSIKAYNQANDRYFVQSSLNTQGIGLQYKKDFNRLTDLFPWLRSKKNAKDTTPSPP